jgi:peptidyl-prolyl cis-trans isomerase C
MNLFPQFTIARMALLGAMGCLALAGCSRAPVPDPTVVATVGDRTIRAEDVQQEIAWRQRHRRPVPEPAVLLEEMISQEALLQKARAAGIDQDPEFQRSWRALLVAKLKERDLGPRLEAVAVTPDELRAAAEKEAQRHVQPAKTRLALIQIKTDPKMNEEQLAELQGRMEEARVQALASSSASDGGFAQAAVNYSEDQASRYKGGDVGWFDEGQTHYRWPANVVAAGFALRNPGDVSAVLRAENGFYLVKKVDTRPASATDTALPPALEDRVGRKLLVQKRESTEKAFFAEARRAMSVQTFPDALAAIPVPATTIARRTAGEPPSLP